MAITLSGGIIHPPDETTSVNKLRSRISYKVPGAATYISLDAYVRTWVTQEEIGRPVSIAKINVTAKYLSDNLQATLINGTEIKIFIGYPAPTDLWFYGYISNTARDGISAVITVQSTGVQLERIKITKDFLIGVDPIYSGRLVEIAKYVINEYTTLDPQGVYFTSTTQTDKLSYSDTYVISILNQIRDLLGWILYERQGIVYLEPKGTQDNSVTLTVGATTEYGCKKSGTWESDQSKIANAITVYGKSDTHSTTELFTGTGLAGQVNTLTYPYAYDVKVEVYVGAAWVEKVGALQGVSTNFDYTSHPELTNKTITWDGPNNYNPPAAADNIRVTYSYPWQPTYTAEDATSIATNGRCEDVITRSDLVTIADVTAFANEQLAIYKDPITRGNLLCRRKDLSIGEVITVVDARNNINQTFTITRMELMYPQNELALEVSTEGRHKMSAGDWRFSMAEKIKHLEDIDRGYSIDV